MSIALSPGQTQVIQNQRVHPASGGLLATDNDGNTKELQSKRHKNLLGEWTLSAVKSVRFGLEDLDRKDVKR